METLKLLLEELSPDMMTMTVADLYQEIEQEDGKKSYKFKPVIDGMKPASDVAKLHEALKKERNDHRSLKDRFKPLSDQDPEDVLARLNEIEELRDKLESAGDNSVSEEKINQIAEKRLARFKAEQDRVLAAITAERDALSERDAATTKQLDDLLIGQALMAEATKKCDPAVIPDVMDIGTYRLKRNEEGEIVTRDDSELPLTEWLTQQLETRSHWNKPSGNGGGGRGNNSGNGGSPRNPFSADNYNFELRRWNPGALAAQDAYRKEHGSAAADAAAKSMGVERPGAAPLRKS